jgi:hypothetical protein
VEETYPNPYWVYRDNGPVGALSTFPNLEAAKAYAVGLRLDQPDHDYYVYLSTERRVVWRSNPTHEEQETAQLKARVLLLEQQVDYLLQVVAYNVCSDDQEAKTEALTWRKGAQ